MPVTFGTSNGVQMKLIDTADTLTNWTGAHDGLEAYGFADQGSDCVTVAIRKNETLPITCTNTVTGVAADNQVIANLASAVAHLADDQYVTINDSNGGASANQSFVGDINGAFQPFAFDCNSGTLDLDTYNFASIVYTWDASGANVRTANNIWMDAAYIGNGVDLAGATANDSLFAEGQAYDISSDTFNGALTEKEGIIYAQSNIYISTTTGNSYGETLVFYETTNGNNAYTLSGNGTADFQNTNIIASGAITLDIDFTSMTALPMSGGSISGYNTLKTKTGQVISGVVFQSGGTTEVNNTISDSPFNECGQITLNGVLSGCPINKNTAAAAVVTDTLNDLSICPFVSDGTGYAVEVTDPATTGQTYGMTWSCTTTGYATNAGTAANREIHFLDSEATNTYNITLGNGASAPSFTSEGANINVITGSVTIDVHIEDQSGSPVNAALVYIDEDLGAAGNIANTTSDASGDIVQANYSGAASSATVRVRKYGFKPYDTTITLLSDSTTNVTLITDPQQV